MTISLLGGCATLPREFRALDDDTVVPIEDVFERIEETPVIFVGEAHITSKDHLVQFALIKHLHERGKRMVVALEMFPASAQPVLDRWVEGSLSPFRFEEYYYGNWSVPFWRYEEIFTFARDNDIPLLGINVNRFLALNVAKKGIDVIPEADRERLGVERCSKGEAQRIDGIMRRRGIAHAMPLPFLCEAQRLRDATMAYFIASSLEHGAETVVVLAGAAHTSKDAVPSLLTRRTAVPRAVLVPGSYRGLIRKALDGDVADFTWD